MSEPLIRLSHVSYTYPFALTRALADVSLDLHRGEVMLVTGASGCGKSTLLKVLNGLIPAHFKGTLEGEVSISGEVGTVLQNPDEQILATTVEEEIALALEWRCVPSGEIRSRVDRVMEMFGLTAIATRSVFKLSSGERQKCVLASVVAAGDEIIVLDEPTANLSPEATEELAAICRTLKERGKTLIIVDHRLYWLRGIVDRLLVLKNGSPLGLLSARENVDVLDDLASCPWFAEAGLRSVTVGKPDLPDVASLPGDAALRVQSLSFRFSRRSERLYADFSVSIPRGRICAITGPNGVGKTTLARLLCGLVKPTSGQIADAEGRRLSPRQLRQQTAFAMQQMDIQLYMHTVEDELRFSARRSESRAKVASEARHYLDTFRLTHLSTRHPLSLSGGEKQRLVVACALMKKPRILILDEPTSGLDAANMRMIADELERYVVGGGAALVITHDLELLSRVATCRLALKPIEEKHQ